MNTAEILNSCDALAPACIARIIAGGFLPRGGCVWRLGNEVKPADLYCYLYAKFGPPNGLQNLFRGDHSNNLIHWDWTLGHPNGLVMILGLNLRTEVHLIGDWKNAGYEMEGFIAEVKKDLVNYGKEMSQLRREVLEDWEMFVNPYKTLRESILNLHAELGELQLDPEREELGNPASVDDFHRFNEQLKALMQRYDRGIGLAMALRLMIPVLAESFINLILFVLCRPDVKQNPRLYESVVRANIDVKVQSLHVNCIGFKGPVAWTSEECANYNSIVNERNDLLHGNIVVGKLKFDEIFFNGKVPVFKQYKTMWRHSVGVSIEASGVGKVSGDLNTVDKFIEYVLSCVDERLREEVEIFMQKRDLGKNKKTQRLGILLPDYIVDFGLSVTASGQVDSSAVDEPKDA